MRLIGHLPDEAAARTFGDYLFVQGIENHVEQEPADVWGIWVKDEDTLVRAGDLLRDFCGNPGDVKFRSEAQSAAALRSKQEQEEAAYRKKTRSRRDLFRPLTAYGMGPLTIALIVISAGVFLMSRFGAEMGQVSALFISSPLGVEKPLQEIRSGQMWRLITPIFLHFTFLHIFFNMLWLKDLGSMIEGRQSTRTLALLVAIIGICSNVAQYFVSGPVFGGMSGVVYGLLGYIWIRGKFDPGSGLFVHQYTVIMMLIWYVLCLTGMLGHIANTAHTVGLVMGVAWGWLASQRYR